MRFMAYPLGVAIVAATMSSAVPAVAQSAACGEITPLLTQRKSIADRIQAAAGGKKQIEAKSACTSFSALVANGQSLVKFIETNKEWCQIPDSFSDGIRTDHSRAIAIRAKACGVAAKQAQMEKQAREGGGSAGGLLGGPGLSGASSMPKGAL